MQIILAVKNFKSCGVFYRAGQVITDPASIKMYKSKVQEGKILVLDRHSKDAVAKIKFLEQKLGVSILKEVKEYLASLEKQEEVEEKVEEKVSSEE